METILYLGILALFLLFIMAIFQNSIFLKNKISRKLDNIENAQYALNKMVWYLQNTQSINEPLVGQSGQALSVNLANAAQNPALFYLEAGRLKMKLGSDAPLDLTSNQIKVTNLNFSNNGFSGEPAIMQISLQVESASGLNEKQPVLLQTSVKIEK